MSRLVSVLYDDFHPWELFGCFTDYACLANPQDLKPGDTIVVHGGADIHPSLYNKERSKMSGAGSGPSRRDIAEWNMMQQARVMGIPIIGICRGAQMLCALAGGFLYQHVSGHGGSHEVVTKDGSRFLTNTLHHQMMEPGNTNHELLAWTPEKLSNVYWDEDRTIIPRMVEREPEFIYFPDVKGFAIQWHPEMMPGNCAATDYIKQIYLEKTSKEPVANA